MKNLWLAFLFLIACSPSKPEMPEAPATPEDVARNLYGKNWVTTRVGTLSPFQQDNKPSYDWLDEMKEAGDFIKKTLGEQSGIQFKFVNDSTANVVGVPDAPAEQKYRVLVPGEEDTNAIRLAFEYMGKSMFGDGEETTLTYTYYVLGSNDKALLLMTPRSVNERPIVILMESK